MDERGSLRRASFFATGALSARILAALISRLALGRLSCRRWLTRCRRVGVRARRPHAHFGSIQQFVKTVDSNYVSRLKSLHRRYCSIRRPRCDVEDRSRLVILDEVDISTLRISLYRWRGNQCHVAKGVHEEAHVDE